MIKSQSGNTKFQVRFTNVKKIHLLQALANCPVRAPYPGHWALVSANRNPSGRIRLHRDSVAPARYDTAWAS